MKDGILIVFCNYLVLVPNNDAFAKLPSDLKHKINDNHQFLVELLEYHILESIICLDGFRTGSIATYGGQDINVTVNGPKVLFNTNSTLIQPNIIAYNGVMQVIDTVLVPTTIYS